MGRGRGHWLRPGQRRLCRAVIRHPRHRHSHSLRLRSRRRLRGLLGGQRQGVGALALNSPGQNPAEGGRVTYRVVFVVA